MREKLNALQTLSYAMTEDEDVDVEEIVAGVIEYLDERDLLADSGASDTADLDEVHEQLEELVGAAKMEEDELEIGRAHV